ncbi:S8 family serine peptidase, partial [Okeania sp. SIO2C9]|uniref:S8 family serine peptidase n=1 Tax=Okeania sp. SIO2C9 TaxID=2607791 RepID=UPI00345DAFD7
MAYGSQVYLYPELTVQGGNRRAECILEAILDLSAGDILLLEMQILSAEGYVPADYDVAVWSLIQTATDAGIVVIMAAGNGGSNLDRGVFSEYRNRGDNGGIIVGAGLPSSTHRRMLTSTYGSLVDVQSWGMLVVSCGYGDWRQFGSDINQAYTQFSGTSSASAVVAGVAALVQEHAKNIRGGYLTPLEMQNLLIASG